MSFLISKWFFSHLQPEEGGHEAQWCLTTAQTVTTIVTIVNYSGHCMISETLRGAGLDKGRWSTFKTEQKRVPFFSTQPLEKNETRCTHALPSTDKQHKGANTGACLVAHNKTTGTDFASMNAPKTGRPDKSHPHKHTFHKQHSNQSHQTNSVDSAAPLQASSKHATPSQAHFHCKHLKRQT